MSGPFASVSAAGLIAVAAGAVLGAWLRWLLALLLNEASPWLPAGTLVANIGGGLMIGAALAWLGGRPDLDPAWRLFIVTGFLGALTTFSTFSAESLAFLQRGEIGLALLHTLIHVAGSLAAAALGFKLVTGMGR